MQTKKPSYFSKTDILLWSLSVTFIVGSYLIFNRENYWNMLASVWGVTSLIFISKGNPFGQLLMVGFSLFYGWISYHVAYYGEMITYLGMTLPMAVSSLISWLKNPFRGNRAEVTINRLKKRDYLLGVLLTAVVTVVFYFILGYFNTANLLLSTFSVTTSFFAVYLTFRRSPFFALSYAVNDVVLIGLWVSAGLRDPKYLSVVICFLAFLVNDLYSFVRWQQRLRRQTKELSAQNT